MLSLHFPKDKQLGNACAACCYSNHFQNLPLSDNVKLIDKDGSDVVDNSLHFQQQPPCSFQDCLRTREYQGCTFCVLESSTSQMDCWHHGQQAAYILYGFWDHRNQRHDNKNLRYHCLKTKTFDNNGNRKLQTTYTMEENLLPHYLTTYTFPAQQIFFWRIGIGTGGCFNWYVFYSLIMEKRALDE